MPNDKELLQQAFDFFSQYIKINEIGQDELQEKAEIILNSIQTRLAQPEPEPVAWFMEGAYKDGTPSFVQINGETDPEFYVPLYTAPPQREWVGLTDEEIIDIWAGVSTGYDDEINIVHLGKTIEAKLKEKNGMD